MGAWNAAYSAATFRVVFIMCAALLPLLFVDRVFDRMEPCPAGAAASKA